MSLSWPETIQYPLNDLLNTFVKLTDCVEQATGAMFKATRFICPDPRPAKLAYFWRENKRRGYVSPSMARRMHKLRPPSERIQQNPGIFGYALGVANADV